MRQLSMFFLSVIDQGKKNVKIFDYFGFLCKILDTFFNSMWTALYFTLLFIYKHKGYKYIEAHNVSKNKHILRTP